MTVEELIEFLKTLDKDFIVCVADSAYPTEGLSKENIDVSNGFVTIY